MIAKEPAMPSLCPTVFALVAITALAAPPSKRPPQPTEAEKRQSYALGREAGLRAQRLGVKIDLPTYQKAISEALKGKPGTLTQEESTKLIKDLEMESIKLAGERNKKEGAAFLATNKQKPGIKVTASGLQYESLREGSGAQPTADDSVKVHYRGTLADGTEFDSSYARNEPATFP
jgi:FKBP-type peptidyl-prolyl cis-trans isomerase